MRSLKLLPTYLTYPRALCALRALQSPMTTESDKVAAPDEMLGPSKIMQPFVHLVIRQIKNVKFSLLQLSLTSKR